MNLLHLNGRIKDPTSGGRVREQRADGSYGLGDPFQGIPGMYLFLPHTIHVKRKQIVFFSVERVPRFVDSVAHRLPHTGSAPFQK